MHGTVKISYMKDLVSADTRARPETPLMVVVVVVFLGTNSKSTVN